MGLVYGGKSTVRDGLVLELDAANQKSWGAGNTWKDTSGQGNNGTLTNGTNHSQGPFPGTGYVTFDGTGDYLVPPNSSDFDLSGDWTVEAWVYITGGNGVLFSSQTTENIQFLRFNSSNGAIAFYGRDYGTGTSYFTNTGSFTNNEWFHVACSCSSGTMKLYVDGTQVDTASFGLTSTRLSVIGAFYYQGSHYTADPMYFNGYISNLRMVKGTALYTSNFTPTKGPLENISNTKLLTCQGSSITDASDSSHTITANGNAAAVYNDVSYFDFDGTNDYVNFGNILNQFPITISAWTKTNSTSETLKVDVVNKYTAASANGYRLALSSNGISGYYFRVSGSYTNNYDTEYGTVSTNTWYHIAMTVDSSGIKFYINGSLVGSNTWTGTAGAPTTTTNLSLGYYPGNTAGGQYYDGEISQVSIYNKVLTSTEIIKNFNALRGRYGI